MSTAVTDVLWSMLAASLLVGAALVALSARRGRLARWKAAQPPTDGRTLPWTFLRRQIRPYAFAVSLACTVIVASMFTGAGVGERLDQGAGKAIGIAALAAAGLLWAGWWARSKRLMDHGLLLSTAVWAAVATIVLTEGSSWPSGLLALAWSVASGGAWLLEVNDGGRGER